MNWAICLAYASNMNARTLNKTVGWTLAGAAAFGAYYVFLRPRHMNWGASREEAEGYLPGDDLVPQARHRATHAITIEASPEAIWPWLVQLGQDKAGFYSFTALENLLGCHMTNAECVHPEWQTLAVGDHVKFHPRAPTVPVAMLQEARHLVIGKPDEFAWGFFLRELAPGRTRLLIRLQSVRKRFWARTVDIAFWEPAHSIMEIQMMRTLKRLAEGCSRLDAMPAG